MPAMHGTGSRPLYTRFEHVFFFHPAPDGAEVGNTPQPHILGCAVFGKKKGDIISCDIYYTLWHCISGDLRTGLADVACDIHLVVVLDT